MTKDKNQYINRELSWLQFNARVLQEAEDESVPLIERFRFLGIFSNNLDEFFKVRYATVKRIDEAGKGGKSELGIRAAELLELITQVVIKQQAHSLVILNAIQKELEKENIFIINEDQVDEEQKQFIKEYFLQKISPALVTIILNDNVELPLLKDSEAYLAVKMALTSGTKQFALIEISRAMDRFVVLPEKEGKSYIMIVDDLIRYCLDDIFNIFSYDSISANMIKITRDGELDFDSDLSKSFIEKISDSVKDREIGDPVRFVYDKTIDDDTLDYLMAKMGINSKDSVIPGGRYHNRRDYMGFPSLGRTDLLYKKIEPLRIKGLSLESSIFNTISTKDFLLHTPYQSFSYVVKFLREAALDPQVKTIRITIYRLAQISHIASSLINAAKNGKKVTVVIELRARFDEQANIDYAEQMQDEGVEMLFGVVGLKVHSKMCVIEREEANGIKRYGFVSTGNFNESTAKIYTDFTLFTANQKILKDINKVFSFFHTNYRIHRYKHIITSPHYSKSKLFALIDNEIENKKMGRPAYIKLKLNSISSYKMVDKLYEASRAGVKIQMIVRGICCLVPGVPGMSENIEVISIIDKFLEHTRLYIFGNNDDPKVYISSADWMTRNIENRVEVSCPIYQDDIKNELLEVFDICWSDNVKARRIDQSQSNQYKTDHNTKVRAQFALYEYYNDKLKA
ncbi:polyphosphate kinase 1 [Psychroserpens sp.]|uniref:polyphosphate kinase 1 n=1 Tax=Psychroserpens sp. TaxID=2020870 RepID=UPI001B054ECE|nr:polyphosphate kinase 1 [Psychroserpens sp.]MBO6606283.1 polyphosphate kinase 1 [Psychroserpens sp.]MBO6652987.1 polyphosphate kinase 1 [Psychroserpens sp.]MBO6680986.1 polyphosphate kinase 1 [Psychroserpens sp.]MBO6750058.1 polyphosphate kinase 1 [Psychroserpens sp.]MBO6914538.1 polyphosphate kinase 1 [Psychroserpens sp.]